MVTFWVALLAISILIYLLLDGFDLGVGILFLLPNSEARRKAMLGAIAPSIARRLASLLGSRNNIPTPRSKPSSRR